MESALDVVKLLSEGKKVCKRCKSSLHGITYLVWNDENKPVDQNGKRHDYAFNDYKDWKEYVEPKPVRTFYARRWVIDLEGNILRWPTVFYKSKEEFDEKWDAHIAEKSDEWITFEI